MEMVTITKERYEELLKSEQKAATKVRKTTKSTNIVMEAILSTMIETIDGSKRSYVCDIKEFAKSVYTTGCDRARNKAIKFGLKKLEEQGKIKFTGYKGSQVELV